MTKQKKAPKGDPHGLYIYDWFDASAGERGVGLFGDEWIPVDLPRGAVPHDQARVRVAGTCKVCGARVQFELCGGDNLDLRESPMGLHAAWHTARGEHPPIEEDTDGNPA